MRDSDRVSIILDAAVDLFAEKGIYLATINEIAQKAGVGIGLIYQYFRDGKADLYLSVAVRFWEELNDQIQEKLTEFGTAEEKLEMVLRILYDKFMTSEKGLRLAKVLNEALPHILTIKEEALKEKRKKITDENRKFLRLIDGIIREGQDQGTFCKTIEASVLRQCLYGAVQMLLYGLFLARIRNEPVGYDESDAQKAVARLINTFLSAKGGQTIIRAVTVDRNAKEEFLREIVGLK